MSHQGADVSEGPPEPSRSTGYPLEEWEARRSGLGERFAEYFEARAGEIVAGRHVAIRTADGTVRTRLIRFRNGAVLELDVVTPDGTGHGMARMDRRILRDPITVIVTYLVDEVAKLGSTAEPLT
jgi:hypothetical protein